MPRYVWIAMLVAAFGARMLVRNRLVEKWRDGAKSANRVPWPGDHFLHGPRAVGCGQAGR